MSDLGSRSILVHILNNTDADLVLQSANLGSTSSAWAQGAEPGAGALLRHQGIMSVGLKTDDPSMPISGILSLTGLGNTPVIIDLVHERTGRNHVKVKGNDQIEASASVHLDDRAHPLWQVELRRRS